MELGIFIKTLLIVGSILGVAVLSQQPFFNAEPNSNSKNYVYSEGAKNSNSYVDRASDWVNANVYNKINDSVNKLNLGGSGEVVRDNATAALSVTTKEIENQKNNFFQNASKSAREFIAKEILNVLHVAPENLSQCPVN